MYERELSALCARLHEGDQCSQQTVQRAQLCVRHSYLHSVPARSGDVLDRERLRCEEAACAMSACDQRARLREEELRPDVPAQEVVEVVLVVLWLRCKSSYLAASVSPPLQVRSLRGETFDLAIQKTRIVGVVAGMAMPCKGMTTPPPLKM